MNTFIAKLSTVVGNHRLIVPPPDLNRVILHAEQEAGGELRTTRARVVQSG